MLPGLSRALWDECLEQGFCPNGSSFSFDDILGVPIANADASWPPLPADVHDFRYWMGGTEEDRHAADREFLLGLKAACDGLEGAMHRVVADRRCRLYYKAVDRFGGDHWRYKPAPHPIVEPDKGIRARLKKLWRRWGPE